MSEKDRNNIRKTKIKVMSVSVTVDQRSQKQIKNIQRRRRKGQNYKSGEHREFSLHLASIEAFTCLAFQAKEVKLRDGLGFAVVAYNFDFLVIL